MVFGFLFPRKNNVKPSRNVSLSPNVKTLILNHLGHRVIPAMPANAQKAFFVASNPKSDLRDIQEVIQSDEAFSSRIIRIANSVYYDRGNRAKTVPEALVIIGLAEAKTFLSSTYLSELFSQTHGLRALLWHHNIAVAILTKWLNSIFHLVEPDLAFLAGLMHDIGKLMMHIRLGPDYEKIIEKAGRLGFCEAETEVFPFDHTDVGLFIAEEWRFSDELKSALKLHHESTLSPGLSWLVQFADLTSHALGIAHPRGFYKYQSMCRDRLECFNEQIGSYFRDLQDYLTQAEENYSCMYDLYGC
ncbi:MAG: HDOD domain-containing protein [Deltaproteobacteria bacterium]|nr:HDOD domain-containing protein [Deltaproteobacteria bacterium]